MVLWQIVTWASKIKRQFGGQNLGGWAHKVGLDLKNVGQKFLIYHWPPAEEGALVLQLCEHNLDQERRHWQGCGGRTRRGGSRRAPRGWKCFWRQLTSRCSFTKWGGHQLHLLLFLTIGHLQHVINLLMEMQCWNLFHEKHSWSI